MALFFLPTLGQDCLETEDLKFRRVLEQHGYQTENLGTKARNPPYAEEYELGGKLWREPSDSES